MSFGHALYYPHINLTNKNWLKYALLYWDKISRIVPSTVQAVDAEDIIRLRSEIDFVENYRPTEWDISGAAQQFFEWYAIHANDTALRDYYEYRCGPPPHHFHGFHRNRINRCGDINDSLHAAALANGTYIHVQKLDRKLKEFLFASGIAIPGEDEWRDWVRIDTEVGLLYMSYLARSIAAETSRPVITDQLSMFVNSDGIARSISRNRHEDLQHRMGTLLLAAYAPSDMNAVTFDQLIAFRRKFDAERRSFFDHVEDLCRSLPSVTSEIEFKDALNHYLPKLFKDAEDTREMYRDMRIAPVLRFIHISIPTSCASITDLVPVELKGVLIGAGMMLGMANALHERKKEKKQDENCALSYLQSLEVELAPDGIIERLRRAYDKMRY